MKNEVEINHTAMKSRFFLFRITWKRRKGKPSEYIGATNEDFLNALFIHSKLANHLKVPTSWIECTIHSGQEFKKLAPALYARWIEENMETR